LERQSITTGNYSSIKIYSAHRLGKVTQVSGLMKRFSLLWMMLGLMSFMPSLSKMYQKNPLNTTIYVPLMDVPNKFPNP
jgi:hypothetical protein